MNKDMELVAGYKKNIMLDALSVVYNRVFQPIENALAKRFTKRTQKMIKDNVPADELKYAESFGNSLHGS
jgi:hypothetical protein